LFINLASFDPEASAHPFIFEVLRAKEHAPTFSSYDVFTFGLVVESVKELEGAS
jgi:hypothetical protein